MQSFSRRTNRMRRRRNNLLILGTIFIFLLIGIGLFIVINHQKGERDLPNNHPTAEENEIQQENDELDSTQPSLSNEEDEEDQEIQVKVMAIGDLMFHQEQLNSAYDEETDTYDFKAMFEDVRPILTQADMTLANFETTVSGQEPYAGYPRFNSPDAVVDAIQYAGVDVLTTANNHMLDTGKDGLKRTVKVLRESGFDTVGAYETAEESRVLFREVEGIKFAMIAYTESTNGLGKQYPKDELDSMLNLMEKDRILEDIVEAKDQDADFIIALMHWGVEYAEEPNEKQREFAEMMAEAGVDLILGSHPHVIQPSEIIEMTDRETFVIYSLGNFISNQRRETLGEGFEPTEDGLIIEFTIGKELQTEKTRILNVHYIPTWVYRDKEENETKYTYRVLPIENTLLTEEISEVYKERMEHSYEATVSKMIQNPF